MGAIMAEKRVRPANMPWLTPMLTVRDAALALEFYETAFGLTRRDVMRDEAGTVTHADLTYHDAVIMIAPAEPGGPRTPAESGLLSAALFYLYCEDVDALFARAAAAGAGVKMPPTDMPWGDRMASFSDLDGHTWNFATHLDGAA